MCSTCIKIKLRHFEFKIHLYLQEASIAPTSNTSKDWIQSLQFGVLYTWIINTPIASMAAAVKKGLGFFPFHLPVLFSFSCILGQGKLLLGRFFFSKLKWFGFNIYSLTIKLFCDSYPSCQFWVTGGLGRTWSQVAVPCCKSLAQALSARERPGYDFVHCLFKGQQCLH